MYYWFAWFVSNVLPFITAVVFFGGIAYRVFHWWRSPRAAVSLVVPPQRRSAASAVGEIATEVVTFRRVFKGSKPLQ